MEVLDKVEPYSMTMVLMPFFPFQSRLVQKKREKKLTEEDLYKEFVPPMRMVNPLSPEEGTKGYRAIRRLREDISNKFEADYLAKLAL